MTTLVLSTILTYQTSPILRMSAARERLPTGQLPLVAPDRSACQWKRPKLDPRRAEQRRPTIEYINSRINMEEDAMTRSVHTTA